MLSLTNEELINVYGGASIMITPYYGFIKVIKWIAKFVSSRF